MGKKDSDRKVGAAEAHEGASAAAAAAPKSDNGPSLLNIGLALLLALVAGNLHKTYVETLFENARFFSALTDLEREMTMHSEQSLYYSYYKDMRRAYDTHPSFLSGLVAGMNGLIYNNMTEYPETINVVQRFNIYPEILLATMYEAAKRTLALGGSQMPKACYSVNQEGASSPLHTCSGWGDPLHFYIKSVFLLQGLLSAGIFLLCWYVSKYSLFSAAVVIVTLFFNFTEFTRAMWTPPLRESFSVPFLPLQILSIVWTLRTPTLSHYNTLAIAASTFLFALPWQFAQFALFTQCSSLFALFLLDIVDAPRLGRVLLAELGALALVWVLQAGSLFLLFSFIFAFNCVVLLALPLDSYLRSTSLYTWIRRIFIGLLVTGATLGLKAAWSHLLDMHDDNHIFDILRSKFDRSLYDFHVQLYVCAAEFDFLKAEYYTLSVTLLLPAAVAVAALLFRMIYIPVIKSWFTVSDTSAAHTRPDLAYILMQAVWFFIMAALIMRLKLFFVLMLFSLVSLMPMKKLWDGILPPNKPTLLYSIVLSFVILGSIAGRLNIEEQLGRLGEGGNEPLRELIEFARHTPPGSAFAGNMPITAMIKCTANRPIVNHPHYEDAGIRNRTYYVYRSNGHFPDKMVWQPLHELQATFLIIDNTWCNTQARYGCNVRDIFDLDYPEHRHEPEFCTKWYGSYTSPYFTKVFENSAFQVLRVVKEPRVASK